MSKTAAVVDSEELNLNILQNVDWDPMEVLHKDGGKITPENFKGKAEEVEEEENEKENDNKQKPIVKKTSAAAQKEKPDFTHVDLTDEQIQGGLKNTKVQEEAPAGKKPVVKEESGAEDAADKGDKKENKTKFDTAFAAHYQLMVEAGEWEEMEGFDGTQASYIKARDHNTQRQLDTQLDEYLDEAFEKNPDGKAAGKKLLIHLAQGGRVSDFVSLTAPQELDFAALDNDDDTVAEAAALDILPRYYASIGWKKPQIDSKMAQLKKTGGAVDEAKIIQEPFQEAITDREKKHKAYLTEQKRKNEANQSTINQSLNSMISTGHSFGALKIGGNKKSQQEYQQYIFTPTEKGVSEFSEELQNNLRDPEFLLFLAVAQKNKLHKNPDAIADKDKNDQRSMDKMESILSKSLLNQDLTKNGSQADGTGNDGGGSASKHKFDLDAAIPIHI